MPGSIFEFFAADHERLDALARQAVADPASFDRGAFDAFREGLLRHIGMEEKFLFPAVRKAAAGQSPPDLRRFRVDHAALTSLLVPTPTPELLGEILSILAPHNIAEEGAGGLYESCDTILGSDAASILARLSDYRGPKLRPYQDHPRVHRSAEGALRAAMGPKSRSPGEPS